MAEQNDNVVIGKDGLPVFAIVGRNPEVDHLALLAKIRSLPPSVLRESQSDLINLNNITNQKLLRSCKFAIHQVRHPVSLPEFGNIPLREFTFLCDSIELPGRSLATTEFMLPGGFKIKTPYRREFNEVAFSFYHNKLLPVYDYFTFWIDSASPTSSGNRYFDEITVDIDLVQFDDSHFKYEQVRLVNAYPLTVASLPCNWADDGFHKVQVTMFYEYIQSVNESTSARIVDRAKNTRLLDGDLTQVTQELEEISLQSLRNIPFPNFNITGG